MADSNTIILKALNKKSSTEKKLPDRVTPSAPPSIIAPPSGFVKETTNMVIEQRNKEQAGHRGLGISVKSEEKNPDKPSISEEQALDIESSLKSNPYLDNQRFDGFDPNTNPIPALNTEARKKYDEIKQEQELQLRQRLGLSPGKNFNPKPER
jgi:hypothetical protein